MLKSKLEEIVREQRERIDELEERAPLTKSEIRELIVEEIHNLSLKNDLMGDGVMLTHNGSFVTST